MDPAVSMVGSTPSREKADVCNNAGCRCGNTAWLVLDPMYSQDYLVFNRGRLVADDGAIPSAS